MCRPRKRLGESPPDKNQREPRDQECLQECSDQRIAQCARQLVVDVARVVKETQRPYDLTIAVKRQRIDVNRCIRTFTESQSLIGTPYIDCTTASMCSP